MAKQWKGFYPTQRGQVPLKCNMVRIVCAPLVVGDLPLPCTAEDSGGTIPILMAEDESDYFP